MAAGHTETMVDFYGNADTVPLLMEFVADAGGDPDQYGAEDNSVETLLATGLGPALKTFTENAVKFGFISDATVAAAAGADDVDWNAVSEVAQRTLVQGMLDL